MKSAGCRYALAPLAIVLKHDEDTRAVELEAGTKYIPSGTYWLIFCELILRMYSGVNTYQVHTQGYHVRMCLVCAVSFMYRSHLLRAMHYRR